MNYHTFGSFSETYFWFSKGSQLFCLWKQVDDIKQVSNRDFDQELYSHLESIWRGWGHISEVVKNMEAGNDLGGPVILPEWEQSLRVQVSFWESPIPFYFGPPGGDWEGAKELPYHTRSM